MPFSIKLEPKQRQHLLKKAYKEGHGKIGKAVKALVDKDIEAEKAKRTKGAA